MRYHLVIALIACLGLSACAKNTAPDSAVPQYSEEELARRQAEEEQRRLEEERQREARRAEAERQKQHLVDVLTTPVYFDFAKNSLRQDASESLVKKVDILRAHPSIHLRIAGHADERGSDEYNLALGARRATAVKDFLVSYGVQPERLEIVSFGEERPADPRSTEEAWAKNRRAEFHIIAGEIEVEM